MAYLIGVYDDGGWLVYRVRVSSHSKGRVIDCALARGYRARVVPIGDALPAAIASLVAE